MIQPVQTSPVASTANTTSAGVSLFAVNVTAGNLIEVSVACYDPANANGTTTVTVTDSLSNTYTQAGSYSSPAGTHYRVSKWYAKNITGGACTITVTPSNTCYLAFAGVEYSGCDTTSPLDSTATNSGTSATFDTTTITVSNNNSLVTAIFGFAGAFAGMFGISAGKVFHMPWVQAQGNSFMAGIALDRISSSSINATCVLSTSFGYAAVGASYKAANPSTGNTINSRLVNRG